MFEFLRAYVKMTLVFARKTEADGILVAVAGWIEDACNCLVTLRVRYR